MTEGFPRNVPKPALGGSAAGLARGAPVLEPVLRRPLQFPESNALLAMEIRGGSYQFIADARLKRAGVCGVNSGDLEFGVDQLRKAGQGGSQLLEETTSRKAWFGIESDMPNFESGAGTSEECFRWLRRKAQESRGKNFFDGLRFRRRVQQIRCPFSENAGNNVVIFFGREIVKTCVRLAQQGIRGSLSPSRRVVLSA